MPSRGAEFMRRANRISAAFSLGREDVGEALAHETLRWLRENGDHPGHQAAILLQLCVSYRQHFSTHDREHYCAELLKLAVDRFDEVAADPDLAPLMERLSILVAGTSPEFVAQWGDVAERTSQRFRALCVPAPPMSALEDVVSLDDPGIPETLGVQLSALQALLEGPDEGLMLPPSCEARIKSLRDILESAPVKLNSQRVLSGEINYLELKAGLRLRLPALARRGAMALFEQPRRMRGTDRLLAATLILRTREDVANVEREHFRRTLKAIDRFVFDHVAFIRSNHMLRFLALNLERTSPLVNAYVERWSTQDPVRVTELLGNFQGCFYSRATSLAGLHAEPSQRETLVSELALLLDHTRSEHAPNRAGMRHPEMHVMHDSARAELEFTAGGTDRALDDIAEVQRHIATSELVLAYYCSEQSVHLLVLTRTTSQMRSLPLRKAELAVKYRSMRGDLHRLYLLESRDFSWIHTLLVRPGLDLTNSRCIRSLVIVDAQLGLPFHLAYDERSQRHLIEEWDVSYCHSLVTFCRSRAAASNLSPRILLSGFSGGCEAGAALPQVDAELASIETCAKSLGVEVSATWRTFQEVQSVIRSYNVFHFSGHVTGLGRGDLAWALHYQDGPVRVDTLLKALHGDVRLACLLGCSSAEQHDSSLVGVNGLLSSLVACGVPHVLGFLWPVPDDVAASLSVKFYDHWATGGGSIRSCLRQSMLEQDRYWGPGVWGGAVCFGA